MNTSTHLTHLIKLISTVALSIAAITPSYATGESEVEVALDMTSNFRYADAFAHFRVAAKLGNIDAQRSAGLMALYGESMYGPEIHANRVEALQWLGLAAKNGDEVSAYMLAKQLGQ